MGRLRDSGLDFVFLSLNDIAYETSEALLRNKLAALANCCRLGMPVWIQRTIDALRQVDSMVPVVERHARAIFSITISNDVMTTFHRGMRVDEVLIKSASPEIHADLIARAARTP